MEFVPTPEEIEEIGRTYGDAFLSTISVDELMAKYYSRDSLLNSELSKLS